MIGPTCNVTFNPCDLMDPCQNDGTCFNSNMTLWGYICLCPSGIGGVECETDYRICQSDTCWNNGELKYMSFDEKNHRFFCFLFQVLVWKHPTRPFSARVQPVGKIPIVNY